MILYATPTQPGLTPQVQLWRGKPKQVALGWAHGKGGRLVATMDADVFVKLFPQATVPGRGEVGRVEVKGE